MTFGIISVFYAKKENILVYPTGIISTGLYVYLLSHWRMYGDLIINIYYTLMSIYGWWVWSRIVNKESQEHIPITKCTTKDYISSLGIFVFTSAFVIIVYRYYNVMPNTLGLRQSIDYALSKLSSGSLSQIREAMPYLDTFTTGCG